MKPVFVLSALASICMTFSSHALQYQKKGSDLILTTERLTVTVRDARIIAVTNNQSKVRFAAPETAHLSRTSGLGNMTGLNKELSQLHFPWGEPSLNQELPPVKKTKLYRYPSRKSRLSIGKKGKSIIATWKGLSDSEKFYEKDSIELRFFQDQNGALAFQGTGHSEISGVFGLQIPIDNLHGKSTLILPSFGGLEYQASGKPGLLGFQDAGLFYEAKFMACQLQGSSLGYWAEDSTFRPYFIMFSRGEKNSSFAFEINNLIPFEQHKQIQTPVFKLDSFAESDWIAAARPYRNWYQKTFAKEIKRRDGIPWAQNIYAICDSWDRDQKTLSRAKELIPAENTLLHVWQARKLGFTDGVPDYTLRDKYPAEVALAHLNGYKVMCYVCSLCAVYQSDAWNRDNVGDFFMTRKDSINNYHGNKNAFDENLVGTLTAARGKDQFANLKKGAFLYGDPLSAGWRAYFTRLVQTLNKESGTDANYQDTLGCTTESGNGIVDGLSGAQGNAALAAHLSRNLPGTPMASEFGPDPIAFAIRWPLNYAQVWGNKKFRQYRIHRQVPLSSFLFGYRPWIPVINAGDAFHCHLISACSDGLGGMGMFSAHPKMNILNGFSDHLVLRAKIFTERRLKPYYPQKRYPSNIRAMYRDQNNKIYQYYDDGHLQMLLDPRNRPLYGRVDGVHSIRVKNLYLPGWPSCDEEGIYGLNPENSYALFPSGNQKPELTLGKLPDHAQLKIFYCTEDYAYLEIAGKGQLTVPVQIPRRFTQVMINDQLSPDGRISGQLPLRVLFTSDKKINQKPLILQINQGSGLQKGKQLPLPALQRYYGGKKLYLMPGYQFITLDTLVQINQKTDAAEIYFRNVQDKYGNGSILTLLVNGREISKLDCCPKNQPPFDTTFRRWRVPLGQFTGKKVLISVRTDNKASNNADMQFVSIPRIVTDADQKFTKTTPSTVNPPLPPPPPKKIQRPSQPPLKILRQNFSNRQIQGSLFTPAASSLSMVTTTEGIQPIQTGKQYILCGKFRRTTDKLATFYLGVIQYDQNKRQIYGHHINRLPKTLSRLSHAARKGSAKLMVFDASQWTIGNYVSLDKELPSRNLTSSIVNIEKYGGDWGVILKKPLQQDWPAETPVSVHRPMNTHLYLHAGSLGTEMAEYGDTITWWTGAKYYQIFIMASAPAEFKDVQMEIYSTEK